jgi:hypothetical protein
VIDWREPAHSRFCYVTILTSTALGLNQSLQCEKAVSDCLILCGACAFVYVRTRPLCVGCVCLVCVMYEHTFSSFKHFISDRQTEIDIFLSSRFSNYLPYSRYEIKVKETSKELIEDSKS